MAVEVMLGMRVNRQSSSQFIVSVHCEGCVKKLFQSIFGEFKKYLKSIACFELRCAAAFEIVARTIDGIGAIKVALTSLSVRSEDEKFGRQPINM